MGTKKTKPTPTPLDPSAQPQPAALSEPAAEGAEKPDGDCPCPPEGPEPAISAAIASEGKLCAGMEVTRPWGSFNVLRASEAFVLKVLTIKPGCRTSYQKHADRDEAWVVASGTAIATINGLKMELQKGAVLRVPAGTTHRLAVRESATEPAVIAEVWSGQRLDEADIVRIEDDYGRVR